MIIISLLISVIAFLALFYFHMEKFTKEICNEVQKTYVRMNERRDMFGQFYWQGYIDGLRKSQKILGEEMLCWRLKNWKFWS